MKSIFDAEGETIDVTSSAAWTAGDIIQLPDGRAGQVTVSVDSGKIVAVLEGVSKSFGERPIVRGLSATILRGDKVGVIGRNGAGKSTLLRAVGASVALGARVPVVLPLAIGLLVGGGVSAQGKENLLNIKDVNICSPNKFTLAGGPVKFTISASK